RVADALTHIFEVFRRLNKYIDETEPWVLAKDPANSDRLATVMYNLTEGITIGTSLLASFLPETADKIVKQLNTELRSFDDIEKFGLYPSGNKVTANPEILFARLDEKEIMKKVEVIREKQKAAANVEQVKPLDHKPEVTIDDFGKMEIRVGKIIDCQKHPKADKLLVFKLKFGPEERQIVSGIAKWYKPEDLIGKKALAIVNLKPVTLRGVESQGMLLSAEDDKGNLELVNVFNVEDGAEVR
ncbi:MAG: methionine--tRNA ligase subunit beta, partial [Erysipelotrichaceae bacterium]|nr:methionine--tRNA ligase subunit beta [Erysipelotrichaceae bacterium]